MTPRAIWSQTRRAERVAEAFAALAHRLEVDGAGDVGDAPTPQPDQMLDGQPRAAAVVGQQAERLAVRDLGEGVDRRHRRAAEIDRGTQVGTAAGDDDAVDALGQQRIDVAALAHRIVGAAQEDRDACRLERALDALEHGNAEPAVAVGRDQADGEGPLAQQALRQVVGPEAQALGRGAHGGTGLIAQLALPIQRLGHGADADARSVGHVANGDRANGCW
jgi:hypothetical protein